MKQSIKHDTIVESGEADALWTFFCTRVSKNDRKHV